MSEANIEKNDDAREGSKSRRYRLKELLLQFGLAYLLALILHLAIVAQYKSIIILLRGFLLFLGPILFPFVWFGSSAPLLSLFFIVCSLLYLGLMLSYIWAPTQVAKFGALVLMLIWNFAGCMTLLGPV